jgi:hypothetical protein
MLTLFRPAFAARKGAQDFTPGADFAYVIGLLGRAPVLLPDVDFSP